ncbi:hypothetical protein L484_020606 [Morus notabilis]|uniref:Uncharacterized protein n=1 Tax=Morus notabilis TaxID=981085 RepID=W9S954_9ROSA|nr:hypothetical protein L484_020606 [Morus notabilis]
MKYCTHNIETEHKIHISNLVVLDEVWSDFDKVLDYMDTKHMFGGKVLTPSPMAMSRDNSLQQDSPMPLVSVNDLPNKSLRRRRLDLSLILAIAFATPNITLEASDGLFYENVVHMWAFNSGLEHKMKFVRPEALPNEVGPDSSDDLNK